MAPLTIHSGLEGFQVLEQLSEVGPEGIRGRAHFDRVPMFVLVEAMAQLAALHVRYLVEFKRHAFLLKVARCQVAQSELLEGHCPLQAELRNQSSSAFAYNVSAWADSGKGLTAELLIGTQAYDDQFQKERLQAYYQKRIDKLLGKSKSKNPLQ